MKQYSFLQEATPAIANTIGNLWKHGGWAGKRAAMSNAVASGLKWLGTGYGTVKGATIGAMGGAAIGAAAGTQKDANGNRHIISGALKGAVGGGAVGGVAGGATGWGIGKGFQAANNATSKGLIQKAQQNMQKKFAGATPQQLKQVTSVDRNKLADQLKKARQNGARGNQAYAQVKNKTLLGTSTAAMKAQQRNFKSNPLLQNNGK